VFFYRNPDKDLLIHKSVPSRCFSANPCIRT